jgi:GTP:adenosylcobinamide-phosphate guanylyltransferase
MEKVKFIEHKGKKIFNMDFSNCLENEVLALIEESKKIIKSQPEKSLLTLTDVTHARYNAGVVAAIQMFVRDNKPHVKAAAIIGVNAVKKIIYKKVMEFSERDIKTFDDLNKAKDWLAGF